VKDLLTKGIVREILITVGLAVVIYLIITTVIQNSEVHDISMQNTLIAGQRLVVVKPYYNFTDPQRGDIIVLRPPMDSQVEFVKRLIGLPGDTILIKGGKVYVNDVMLNEPYIKEVPLSTYGPFTVPEGRYFVMGDNRNHSSDSRTGWTITREEIVGKAVFRYWPLNKFGEPGNYPLNKEVESGINTSPLASVESP
jgi:signal peptidase I